jgi:hypothetical protein
MLTRRRVVAAAANSLFSYWWDVTNDWGLDLLDFRRPAAPAPAPKRQSLPRPLVLPALHGHAPADSALSPSSPSFTAFSGPGAGAGAGAYPWGLRRVLLFPLPVYPLLVFADLVLRLTWSIKLSAHLHTGASAEGAAGILWLEVCELVRRWAWVFVRVEWEIVRRGAALGAGAGMAAGARASGEEYELVFVDDEGERE